MPTLTLTIDGRKVTVPPGATILDAAAKLGIDIPTLCFLKGYEPSSSCLVCMVKNQTTGRLVPACATRAEAGMEIESETDEVFGVRRTALELLFSDHVGDCLAPCLFACPAHMDIPLMLRQIGDNEMPEAIATIKKDIALPAVLGRICSKPCEMGCRRASADGPAAICELKRFVADEDLATDNSYQPDCKPTTGKKVAIVGAGPTGLAAAFELQQAGHMCTLHDSAAEPGGRLRSETTSEELPRDILDAEIEQILRLGVALKMGTPIDDRRGLQELADQFDAVLVACGTLKSEQIERFGLEAGRRGISIDHGTYETGWAGVFAAGNAVRGSGLPIRSVADGKEAAESIDQFLCGEPIEAHRRPFSSRVGQVSSDEMDQFLAGASPIGRDVPDSESGLFAGAASEQANRCLACGCSAHNDCRLEYYAKIYNANPNRFAGERQDYEVIGRDGLVRFEPGKCIKCELCVKIATRAGEPLGLAFVGRGFDVRLDVPFGHNIDEALTRVGAECVAACPTGGADAGAEKAVYQVGGIVNSEQQRDSETNTEEKPRIDTNPHE